MDRTPERQLWCAVLTRALHDALGRTGATSAPEERSRTRTDALRWFEQNGVDFRSACEAAGYDPDFLRRRVLNLTASAGDEAARAAGLAPGD